MQTDTYVIFVKTSEAEVRTIKVKATGYVQAGDNSTISFENGGKRVAIFNLKELIGFAKSDHIEQ